MRPRLRAIAPLLLLAPARLAAQTACVLRSATEFQPPCPTRAADSRARVQLGVAAANAALGGVTAGVTRGVRARSWRAAAHAFAAGAAGGAGVYAGKRAAAGRFSGAGLAGRQLAAVGASVVRDAGAGRAPLSRLVLPVGPVRVYVGDDRRRGAVRVRVDAATVVGAVVAAREPGARFDLRASLSAGALAFTSRAPGPALACATPCGVPFGGYGHADGGRLGSALGGALWVLDRSADPGAPPGATARTRAHEQVHLVQYDAAHTLWALDGERRLFAAAGPPGRRLGRWVDLGLHAVTFGAANHLLPYERRPWEREAHLLAGSGGDAH